MRLKVLVCSCIILQSFIIRSSFADDKQYCTKNESLVQIKFINNCTESISISSGSNGNVPIPCLTDIGIGLDQSRTIYVPAGGAGPAFFRTFGKDGTSRTRFEIAVSKLDEVWWNISANAGWDKGLTILAPGNTIGPQLMVVKSDKAPGTYAKGGNDCAAQPCQASLWKNNSKKFEVYFCNRPKDNNTMGLCGCKQCQQVPCVQDSTNIKTCTTSGKGSTGKSIYCSNICPKGSIQCTWPNPNPECIKQTCPD